MAGETSDARKRRREQQAEVQKRFNTREDEPENPDVGLRCGPCRLGLGVDHVLSDPRCEAREPETNDNPMEGLPEPPHSAICCGGPSLVWREDFPEPEWHKQRNGQVETFRDPYEGTRKHDPVTKPEHYTHSRIEVWDAIDAWGLGYRLGNVVKYVARADRKGAALQDLLKAQRYLEREIATRQQDARDW